MDAKILGNYIAARRKELGMTQANLAEKIHVTDKAVSRWERGLSVPDSDMLISISEVLETPVSTLLGETISESKADDLRAISEKLEVINLQLAQRKQGRQKAIHWFFIFLCVIIVIAFAVLILLNSTYLGWDYSDPENAVIGIGFHAMEWLFTRIAPLVLIGAAVGAFLTRKK